MTPDLTHALISAAIRTQTAEWLASGKVPNVRAIGNGWCYDFCEELYARLGFEDDYVYEVGPLEKRQTEDWWMRISDDEAECFCADIPRLRAEGAPLPDDLDDRTLSGLIGAATHEWISFEGLHFDATAPEGVDHWLKMPFFANQIAGRQAEALAGRAVAA